MVAMLTLCEAAVLTLIFGVVLVSRLLLHYGMVE